MLGLKPIMCGFYCHHGKHRSVAAAFLIAWCLREDGFFVNPGEKREVNYVVKLQLPYWSGYKCGKKACPS